MNQGEISYDSEPEKDRIRLQATPFFEAYPYLYSEKGAGRGEESRPWWTQWGWAALGLPLYFLLLSLGAGAQLTLG